MFSVFLMSMCVLPINEECTRFYKVKCECEWQKVCECMDAWDRMYMSDSQVMDEVWDKMYGIPYPEWREDVREFYGIY